MSREPAMIPSDVAPPDRHQADPAYRRRLRWRARRGLLENDLLLTRFLDRYETELTDGEVAGLDRLLDLTDNDLLDLILERREPGGDLEDPEVRRVLQRLRAA
jgi:antitoxin CptB